MKAFGFQTSLQRVLAFKSCSKAFQHNHMTCREGFAFEVSNTAAGALSSIWPWRRFGELPKMLDFSTLLGLVCEIPLMDFDSDCIDLHIKTWRIDFCNRQVQGMSVCCARNGWRGLGKWKIFGSISGKFEDLENDRNIAPPGSSALRNINIHPNDLQSGVYPRRK